MRILASVDSLSAAGGTELSSLQVCRELHERGHTIDVLYRESGDLHQQWAEFAASLAQVPSFLVRQTHPFSDARRIVPAVVAARAIRPDVIWLNRVEHLAWGLATAKSTGAPLVCHLRIHPHFPRVKLISRWVSRYIAVSEFIKRDWVRAGAPEESIDVVLNGIDRRDYPYGGLAERAAARAKLGLDPDVFLALYYGRLHEGKGLETLFDAWRRLGDEARDAVLLIAGNPYPTPEGESYGLHLKRSAPDQAVFVEMRRDVTTLLHAADVVVLPAQWQEPFGRVVAEGLSSGRPVVASRVGGIPEQLTGEFSGWLFDPHEPDELAATIRSLMDWRSSDPHLGERCAEHARECLSLRATVDGVERILTDVASRARGPAEAPRSSLIPGPKGRTGAVRDMTVKPVEPGRPGPEDTFRAWLFQDWAANTGYPDSRMLLLFFRFAQWARGRWGPFGSLVFPPYWLLMSLVVGVELSPSTRVGPGLRMPHPHAIVINPAVRIGAGCLIRHGVTLGNTVRRDGTERGMASLGDFVELGAGCAVVGPVHVGDHARVGALAVVTKSVPAWGVVAGNPARLLTVDEPDVSGSDPQG